MVKPILYMLCGLPGSCKSTWADNNQDKLNAVIHSSDSIREELGDVNDQSKNENVFNILHKRIKDDLNSCNNVIYDATNLKRKRRINFLHNELRDIPCEKVCILFATPIETCKKNNASRERKVPEDVIERMVRNFDVPCYQEGFNNIQIVWYDYKSEGIEYDFYSDLLKWHKISHDSPHHSLSIGKHMLNAYNYYLNNVCYTYEANIRDKYLLSMATLMHDCGKTYVKSFVDKDGNISEKARYYEHHNVGSYKSLFYLNDMFHKKSFSDDEILYISLLINCHMRHFMAYKDSEKARERDKRLFGYDFMKNLDILHKCDLASH